eukprot:c6025_g1_i2.p2 GENE.c6025_g1_i2~~c6025_g1_i2.p2  ORF type:complete len:137 (-),score=28.69 c6025_g1_i2:467-877(-)
MLSVIRSGRLAVVKLHQGKANALNTPFLQNIAQTFNSLSLDNECSSIVLTSASPSIFCAGIDLPYLSRCNADEVRALLDSLDSALVSMMECSKPIVASINGHALAGGCVLAAACDHRLMTDNPSARIGVTELAVGV